MPPEQPLPVKCNRIYQIMWANNGDAISRQYAGTAALKVRGSPPAPAVPGLAGLLCTAKPGDVVWV